MMKIQIIKLFFSFSFVLAFPKVLYTPLVSWTVAFVIMVFLFCSRCTLSSSTLGSFTIDHTIFITDKRIDKKIKKMAYITIPFCHIDSSVTRTKLPEKKMINKIKQYKIFDVDIEEIIIGTSGQEMQRHLGIIIM